MGEGEVKGLVTSHFDYIPRGGKTAHHTSKIMSSGVIMGKFDVTRGKGLVKIATSCDNGGEGSKK